MAEHFVGITSIDEVILRALSDYVRGRADEIVSEHIEAAKKEIEDSVRDEVSKTVLSIGKMVSFKNGTQNEIIITISDQRKP